MTRTQLKELVKEMLDEANATNVGGASFSAGDGATYATPNFLGKATRAKKTLKKQGYKEA